MQLLCGPLAATALGKCKDLLRALRVYMLKGQMEIPYVHAQYIQPGHRTACSCCDRGAAKV